MLVGSWQIEHPEGHDKSHGMYPFYSLGLTTMQPAGIMIRRWDEVKEKECEDEEDTVEGRGWLYLCRMATRR